MRVSTQHHLRGLRCRKNRAVLKVRNTDWALDESPALVSLEFPRGTVRFDPPMALDSPSAYNAPPRERSQVSPRTHTVSFDPSFSNNTRSK